MKDQFSRVPFSAWFSAAQVRRHLVGQRDRYDRRMMRGVREDAEWESFWSRHRRSLWQRIRSFFARLLRRR